LVTLSPQEFGIVASLFEGHRLKRIDIDATLDGATGSVTTDNLRTPRTARIQSGGYSIFGGDPDLPESKQLVQECSRSIVVEDDRWEELLIQIQGHRLGKFVRYEFSSENLDQAHLQGLVGRLPTEFHLQAMDVELAGSAVKDIGQICLGAFRTPADQVDSGPGFCVAKGDRVVSAATAAVVCKYGIDIQITTHAEFRRLGLATSVSAALILRCLERSIEPHWSAANDWSAELARKLGYVEDFSFVQYYLRH
jgi:hypothetical protein